MIKEVKSVREPRKSNIGNCEYCGRFSIYHPVRWESNSNEGTYAVISWTCKKCGYCEEET